MRTRDCVDDLRKLCGLPPYDDGANPCRSDGIFMRSIEKKYDADVLEEAWKIIKAEQLAWKVARHKFMKEQL